MAMDTCLSACLFMYTLLLFLLQLYQLGSTLMRYVYPMHSCIHNEFTSLEQC